MNRYDPSLPTALLAGFSTIKGNPVLFPVCGYENCWPTSLYEKAKPIKAGFHLGAHAAQIRGKLFGSKFAKLSGASHLFSSLLKYLFNV